MSNLSVLQSFAYIDDRYVVQADEPVQSKPILLRITAVAACLCLLVGGGVLAYHQFVPQERIIVTSPPDGSVYISSCCGIAPKDGEVLIDGGSSFLSNEQLFSLYSDRTVYQMEIYLHDVSGTVFRQPCCRKEAKRLADCGLEVYTRDVEWTGYWGETVRRTSIVALLTKEQLENFPANKLYGYSLSFTYDDIDLSEYTLVK